MQPRDLNLPVGASFVLEKTKDGQQYLVELLGYAIGTSLIITAPWENDQQLALAVGDEITLRYLGEHNQFSFSTQVSHIAREPYWHIHLHYPVTVAGQELRRSPRIPLHSEAQIKLSLTDGEHNITVKMGDISLTGARLQAPRKLAKTNGRFTIEIPVMSANQSRAIALRCLVKHVTDIPFGPEKLYYHGVEFEGIDQSTRELISRFIQKHTAISA